MAEETVEQAPSTPQETPAVEQQADITKMDSAKLRSMIEGQDQPKQEAQTPQEAPKQETQAQDEWFDKERGFRTKDDALKSYSALQNHLREKSETLKAMESELQAIRTKEATSQLTEADKIRQGEIEKWKGENRQALDLIKAEVKKEIEMESFQDKFKREALDARKKWKEDFDKDDTRKTLWPKMEEIYAREDVFQSIAQNPFPFIEARAFQENFPSIAEKIRQEAVEQYKAQLKQVAEVEKQSKTATPGGLKSISSEVDVSKLSSSEIAKLLARQESD